MESLVMGVGAVAALLSAGVLNAVETAVAMISRAQVEEDAKENVPGAQRLLAVLDRKSEHINLLVLLSRLLDVTAAVLTGALALQLISSRLWAMVAAIAGVTLVMYTIIGISSRTLARRNPYVVARNSALALSTMAWLLGPAANALVWVGNKLVPGEPFQGGPYTSEVALLEMVDFAQERGVVEVDERRMIQSILDLSDTTARSVMVPRPEMVWIEADKTAGQATALCVRSGHSRIPVVGENVDDIVGVVYLKDVVQKTYHKTDAGRGVSVSEVMRPATFVPDSKKLDDLLEQMQRERFHIAMLVDEYGGIAGLISIEDILEEIVGEIADEYDDAEVAPIEQIGPRTFRVVSRLSLDDLHDLVDEMLDEDLVFSEETLDQVDTVGGLLAYALGRVPLPGVTVEHSGLRLTAEGQRDRRGRMRVTSVLIDVQQPADPLEH